MATDSNEQLISPELSSTPLTLEVRDRHRGGDRRERSAIKPPRILTAGFLPPPYNGMSTAMEQLVAAAGSGKINLCFVDIADRRGISNIGRFDVVNVVVALRCGANFIIKLITRRPEVVYVTIAQNRLGYLRDLLFLIPARMLRRRIVVHLHGGNLPNFYAGSPQWFKLLIRVSLRPARRAIVLGESLRPQFDGLVPSARIAVVPNGVEVQFFPERGPGDSAGNHIIHVGALTRSKGTFDVIAAMARVRKAVPDALLTLAGAWYEESERVEATSLIAELDLSNAVQMVGPVMGPKKVRLFMSADILVLPTQSRTSEGQPYVILEAMAAAIPVVTSPAGAIEELLVGDGGGTIVPHKDIGALADAIIRYLRDPELRRKAGEAGRRRVIERFTADRWMANMISLFHEVRLGG